MSDEKQKVFPAKVVKVLRGGLEVVINRGKEHGIEEDKEFLVYALGDELQDPDTGESLGTLEIVRGTGFVTHVQEKIATISSNETKRIKLMSPDPYLSLMHRYGKSEKVEIETEPFQFVKEGDLAKPI